MKIKRADPPPQVIKLELELTQRELDYITSAVGGHSTDGYEGVSGLEIYEALLEAGGRPD